LPRILQALASLSDIWMRFLLPALQTIVAFSLKYLGFLGTRSAILILLHMVHLWSPCLMYQSCKPRNPPAKKGTSNASVAAASPTDNTCFRFVTLPSSHLLCQDTL
jgi:hypothetical protein